VEAKWEWTEEEAAGEKSPAQRSPQAAVAKAAPDGAGSPTGAGLPSGRRRPVREEEHPAPSGRRLVRRGRP